MPNLICHRLHPPPRDSGEENNQCFVSSCGSTLNTVVCKPMDNILRHIVGQNFSILSCQKLRYKCGHVYSMTVFDAIDDMIPGMIPGAILALESLHLGEC